jgi:hypothetical protein
MHKIASPQELKLELQTLIKLAESPRPSREALAQGLQSLAIALKKGSASTTELAGLRSSVLEHLEALDRMIGKPNKAMYDLKDAYAENRDQKSEWLVEKAILSLLHARDDVRDLKSFLNKQTEKARGRIDDEGRQIFPKD